VPIPVQELLGAHIDLTGPLSRRELRTLAQQCPCPQEQALLLRLEEDTSFRTEVLGARWSSFDVSKAILIRAYIGGY